MQELISVRNSAVLVLVSILSSNVYAQEVCDIQAPNTDVNNDGLADQFVSPDAIVRNSTFDCSEHNVQAGALIRRSGLLQRVAVEPLARVVDSSIAFNSTVASGARIINSTVESSEIGTNARVRAGAFVEGSLLLSSAIVIGGSVARSEIGTNSFIHESTVSGVIVLDDVRVTNGSSIQGGGNLSNPFSVIGSGTRIIDGASIEGPIQIGEDARIRARAFIGDQTIIGENFRIGEDSNIAFGSQILDNVTIGKRVAIAFESDIGENTRIASDTIIGNSFVAGSDVIVRRNSAIGDGVSLGNSVTIGSATAIGHDVRVSSEVIVGKGSTIGASAVIESGAIVRAGSSVPGGFTVLANTIFPNDYPG